MAARNGSPCSKPYPIRRRLPRAPAGWREGCAGRRRGCPGCGWRRPVRYGARGAGPWLRGLVPEAGWRKVGRLAVDQPPVQPGRAVRSDLFVQIDRGKDANAGLTVSAGVMGGGTADPDHRGCAIGRRRSARRYRPGVAPPAARMGIDIAPHSRRLERGLNRTGFVGEFFR